MAGYIKLYRSILENPIVMKDSDYFAVWCYLLLSATHSGYDVMFNGERVLLRPGQLTTGRKIIAEKTKVSESKVQRILKTFENEHQIEQQTNNQCRLISILNWDKYQQSEQQNGQQVNNNRTTSEQQMNTKQECSKNDENEKNDYYSLKEMTDEHTRNYFNMTLEERREFLRKQSELALQGENNGT